MLLLEYLRAFLRLLFISMPPILCFAAICSFGALNATMDATTNAAAALAIATEHNQFAALQQVLLDRERAAMTAEDHRSLLARLFTKSSQVPGAMRPTWTAAYRHVQNDVIYLRGVMNLALRAILQNNIGLARMHLENEIDSNEDLDWGEP